MPEAHPDPIKLLMVDDDLEDFLIIEAYLSVIEGQTFVFEHIDNYEEGLAAMLQQRHDVYLVDLRLGGHSGLDLIGQVSASLRGPIILLTGTGSHEVDVAAMGRGAHDYISKNDLSARNLERAIRYAVDRARATERVRESEARLRRSEQEFRHIIENHPDGVAILRDGLILFANSPLAMLLGQPTGALEGQLIERFFSSADAPDVRDRLRDAAQAGRSQGSRRYRLIQGAEGAVAHVEWMPARCLNFEGDPAVMVVLRDITAEHRRLAQSMLSERLTSIGTMAAGMAHELNNPLAIVSSNLDQISFEIKDIGAAPNPGMAERLKDMVSDAQTGAERIRLIIQHLSTFSEAPTDTTETVSLPRLIDLMSNMALGSTRDQATIVREYEPGLPDALGNEAQLGQVFFNLMLNAAQAIPAGNPDKNEIRLRCFQQGGHVIAEIADTGNGIPEHLIHRIFDPFFTTRPVGDGFGLGLSVCHSIVTHLGGTITVKSAPGRGTTFRVSLLASSRRSAASSPSPSPSHGPVNVPRTHEARQLRLLIVDDEPLIASTLGRSLDAHDVTIALNGPKALDLLAHSPPFDAVFCDVLMPGMSGMELFKSAADQNPDIAPRFVFMVGGTFTPQTRDFLSRVHNPVLTKPFRARQIERILTRVALGGPPEDGP